MVDSGSNNYSNGLGWGDAMERDKKVRIKGLKCSSSDNKEDCETNGNCDGGGSGESEGEEGYGFPSPLNTNGVCSRKKFKLRRKVSDERYTVDPASVPRKLRSAINKRISQSSSPPMPVSKKRQLHASSGTQNFNCCSEKLKQKMLDPVTKVEEEVAEILASMSTLISICESYKLKENGRMLEEDLETKATSASLVGDSKEAGTRLVHPCNGSTPTNPSPPVVDLHEITNVDPKLDAKSSSEPNSLQILYKMKPEDVTPSKQAINLSKPLDGSLQCISRNRLLESHLDAVSTQKHEMGLGIWPIESSSRDQHDLQFIGQKPERDTNGISLKEVPSDVQPGNCIGVHEHLAMQSSSKTVACSNPNSTSGLRNEMLSLNSSDKKRTWNRCTTHVYLTHLIQNHQKPKKIKQQIVVPVNQSKAKEETNNKITTSGETGGSQNGTLPLSNGSLFDRNMLDPRARNLQDERFIQAQQVKQGFGILSFAGHGDTKSSGNGSKSNGPIHVSYPPPYESVMPFGFPRGPYTSHYPDQFPAAPNQQVQLQPSPYPGISPSLYGPHMGHPAGSTAAKQQQQLQMWQAQLAHYRPQLGFPPKWQQQQQHLNPSSSSPTSPYNPHNTSNPHFILPMPSSSSSLPSRSKQQQQQQQMQMVCNADSFR